MTNTHSPDDQLFVSYLANHPVIAHTVTPFFVVPLERLAAKSRVIRCLYFVHKSNNPLLQRFIKPTNILDRLRGIDNFIAQGLPLALRE